MTLFRVLGRMDLQADDGTVVEPAGSRQRSLMAALVARAGHVVPVDVLVDLLWGDRLPAQPANALHTQVSRLRERLRAGGADVVRTRPGGYLLDVSPGEVDANRFETACRRAEGSEPADALALLDEALGLWHGEEAYAGVDDDGARAEAVRLRELRHTAVESRARVLLDLGRAQDVVSEMEAYVAEHPLRESARATLMRALYATGRHADALAHFDDHRRRLIDELGLEPSPDLRELQQQVLRHEIPQQRPPRSHPVDAAVPRELLPAMTVRYLTAPGGRRIAWASAGDGPTVVVMLGWVSSLEVIASGRDPRSGLLERLARRARIVTYDRAGTGLSRDASVDASLDYAAHELDAVLDAAGGRAAVLAMSQAGPVALRLAARRPEQIRSLALFGTYANGPLTFRDAARNRAVVDLVRAHWGLAAWTVAGLYRPALTKDGSAHLAKILRGSAPAEVAADYLEAVFEADVSADLDDVTCPALVMHYRGDRVIPFRGGEHLARHLPSATFLPLEGAYHLPDVTDLDRLEGALADLVLSTTGS